MIRVTDPTSVAWNLPKNDLWNVPPAGVHEVHFETETASPWGQIRRLRGLVIDERGYVYGTRSLQKIKTLGYDLEGRVSVAGETWRAFTSAKLFYRPDGSLCNVAVLYLCTDGRPAPYPEERS